MQVMTGLAGLRGAGHARCSRGRAARLCGCVTVGAGLVVTLAAAAGPSAPRSTITNYRAGLFTVSADSARDGWSVGITAAGRPLVLHWTGSSWEPVAIPDASQSEVSGVSTLSPSDAWAVGAGPGKPAANTLILHWNGTIWKRVPSPSPHPGQGSSLTSVSALSPTDAWAVGVGSGSEPASSRTLALYWNGTSWALVPTPDPTRQSSLDSVSADSRSDAWAVGLYFAGKRTAGLAMHWNGTSWIRVPTPEPGGTYTVLKGVSALSSHNAWAVGTYLAGTGQKTLVLHWNGTTWRQVPSPSPGDSALTAVSALSSRGAWAVGAAASGTLVLHWNGTSWKRVPSPSPGGLISTLSGVSAVSPSSAWAVGCECPSTPQPPEHTVILHWNGITWTRS